MKDKYLDIRQEQNYEFVLIDGNKEIKGTKIASSLVEARVSVLNGDYDTIIEEKILNANTKKKRIKTIVVVDY